MEAFLEVELKDHQKIGVVITKKPRQRPDFQERKVFFIEAD